MWSTFATTSASCATRLDVILSNILVQDLPIVSWYISSPPSQIHSTNITAPNAFLKYANKLGILEKEVICFFNIIYGNMNEEGNNTEFMFDHEKVANVCVEKKNFLKEE